MAIPDKPSRSENPVAFCFRHLKILTLLVMVFILFFYKLGSYPLFDLDEPRYAEAAREMLESGNWITPYFNYELRFDKPVLFYWLVAFSYKMFGLSEFAARFFSAVAATGIVLMLYLFGRRWISGRFGFFASLILATSLMMIGNARMSITDMTLAAWMTATTLCLFMAAHHNLRWWLAAGVFAGLGVLTKGPVALVVPGAIFCLYTLLIGEFRRCLFNRWLPLALLVCIAVAAPWYILAYRENGHIFVDALMKHNVTRFADTVSGHKQPVYFYVIVLLVGFLPWTVYLPAAIRRLLSEAMRSHREHVANRHYPYLVSLYAAVWIAFIFVFFTVSNTKLLTYILPLFPALALLTAEAWHTQSLFPAQGMNRTNRWFAMGALLLAVAGAIGGWIFVTNMETLLPREAVGITGNGFNIAAVLVMVCGAGVTAWLLFRHRPAPALLAQACTMALVAVIALHGIIPNISRATQGVMLDYLAQTDHEPLMLYEIQRPSLTFYGQRKVPRYVKADQREMLQTLNRNKRTFVITKSRHLPAFSTLLPASMEVRVLEKDPVYSLLSVVTNAATPQQGASP